MAQVLSNTDSFANNYHSKDRWGWNQSTFPPAHSTSLPSFTPSTLLPLMARTRDNEKQRKNTSMQPSKPQNKQTRSTPKKPVSQQHQHEHQQQRPKKTTISSKRAQHLERNRVAANKCRLKKKKEQEEIQRTVQDESAKQEALLAEINSLNEEVWSLKNKMFQHAVCDDEKIKSYLAGMTQNVLLNRSPGSDATSTTTNTNINTNISPPLSVISFSDESIILPGDEGIDPETGEFKSRSFMSMGNSFARETMPSDTYADNLFDVFIDAGNT